MTFKNIKKFFLKKINLLKYLFFLICLVLLIDLGLDDYSKVEKIISRNYEVFLIVIVISIINLNIVVFRFYFYLKNTLNYPGEFINWSKLFFQTVVMNFIIGGSGHVLRAIQLKKKK